MAFEYRYPSPAWIIIPILLIPLSFWVTSRLRAYYKLKRTGIGRGAPGFQTNVRRIAVTPEIAARLRRGEQVSPEEIAAAVDAAAHPHAPANKEEGGVRVGVVPPGVAAEGTSTRNVDEEWLPDGLKDAINKRTSSARRGKKRR